MIRWQRSSRSAGGRNLEAIQWAKEVSAYVESKQPDYKVQAFTSLFGDVNMLVWQIDFENLAALDKFEQFFSTDQGYWALIKKAEGFFMEGTTYDTVFEGL